MSPTQQLLRSVAAEASITVDALLERCGPGDGSKDRAQARFKAMYLLRDVGRSYQWIGREMGGLHHTTVMNGVARHEQKLRDVSTARPIITQCAIEAGYTIQDIQRPSHPQGRDRRNHARQKAMYLLSEAGLPIKRIMSLLSVSHRGAFDTSVARYKKRHGIK